MQGFITVGDSNFQIFLCRVKLGDFYVHGTVHLSNTSFYKIPTRCNLFCLFGLFFQLYMFRTQSASIFRVFFDVELHLYVRGVVRLNL